MPRKAEFYQEMANFAAEHRNQEFRDGWNAAMDEVMAYDKPWTDPTGSPD